MKNYIHSIYILAKVISFPIGFFILIGLAKLDIKMTAIFIGIMLIYWGVYFQLRKEKKYFFWISFIPIVIVWIVLFVQETKRILFIFENGGMDRADGYGSPMAFLLGMSFELIFFIPISYALFSGISYLKNKKDNKALDDE